MGILLTKLLGSKVILTSDERWTAEQLDPELEIEHPENFIRELFGYLVLSEYGMLLHAENIANAFHPAHRWIRRPRHS